MNRVFLLLVVLAACACVASAAHPHQKHANKRRHHSFVQHHASVHATDDEDGNNGKGNGNNNSDKDGGNDDGRITPEPIPSSEEEVNTELEEKYREHHIIPELTDMLPPHCEDCQKKVVEEHIIPEFKEERQDVACVPTCGLIEYMTPELKPLEPNRFEDGTQSVRIVSHELVDNGVGSNDKTAAVDQFENSPNGDIGEAQAAADQKLDDAQAAEEAAKDEPASDGELEAKDDLSEFEGGVDGKTEKECDKPVTSTTTTVTTVSKGPASEVNKVQASKVAAAVGQVVNEEGGAKLRFKQRRRRRNKNHHKQN